MWPLEKCPSSQRREDVSRPCTTSGVTSTTERSNASQRRAPSVRPAMRPPPKQAPEAAAGVRDVQGTHVTPLHQPGFSRSGNSDTLQDQSPASSLTTKSQMEDKG